MPGRGKEPSPFSRQGSGICQEFKRTDPLTQAFHFQELVVQVHLLMRQIYVQACSPQQHKHVKYVTQQSKYSRNSHVSSCAFCVHLLKPVPKAPSRPVFNDWLTLSTPASTALSSVLPTRHEAGFRASACYRLRTWSLTSGSRATLFARTLTAFHESACTGEAHGA